MKKTKTSSWIIKFPFHRKAGWIFLNTSESLTKDVVTSCHVVNKLLKRQALARWKGWAVNAMQGTD